MIKNERQYRITKAQVARFEHTLAEIESRPKPDIHPRLRRAELEALRSQLADLRVELADFDDLRSGRRKIIPLESIEDLSKALIQARIAAGLSQEVLAERVGVKPQQIQRYEATNYRSASIERVNQIVRALGIKLREKAALRLVS